MAFGSNSFPIGPNGQFPRQRISRLFSGMIVAASPRRASIEQIYRKNKVSRLPVVEKEYSSSVSGPQDRMKRGMMMRRNQNPRKFRPRNLVPITASITKLVTPAIKGQRMGVSVFSGRTAVTPQYSSNYYRPASNAYYGSGGGSSSF